MDFFTTIVPSWKQSSNRSKTSWRRSLNYAGSYGRKTTNLRQEVATALNANRQLEDKIGGATKRLEALLQQIPDDAT
jgi:hypothetical protein